MSVPSIDDVGMVKASITNVFRKSIATMVAKRICKTSRTIRDGGAALVDVSRT
jgi:hypothetical protein